jgi:hypothetical protein
MPFRAELAAAHEEEERLRRRRYLRYLVVIGVVTLIAVGLVIWLVGDTRGTVADLQVEVDKIQDTQKEIQQAQAEGRVRGLKLRALACRNLERQGETFEADDPCRDAELVPWFEPSPPPTRTEGP